VRRAPLLAALLLATVSPAWAAPAAEESVHVVHDGETLNGIANRAGVSAAAIVRANGLKEPYVLKLGQKLDIPRTTKARPAKAKLPKPTAMKPSVAKPATTTKTTAAKTTAAKTAAAKETAAQTSPVPAAVANKAAADATKTAARVIEARKPDAAKPAAKPAPGNPETESYHLVQTGETLGGIAARAKVPRVLIAEANGLPPPHAVRVGQKLLIPRTRHHTVAAGDTGFSIAMQYGVPWEQVALANSLDPAKPVKVGQALLIPTLLDPPPSAKIPAPPPQILLAPPAAKPKAPRFAWPVSGPLRRGFAAGSDYHDGVDITAAKGTAVRAAAAGTVKFAGKEKEQFGNLVVLDHGDGWYTAYGFLNRITVKEGANVAAGERIGMVGSSGMAKGSELHFEVRREGKPVDPLDELPSAP